MAAIQFILTDDIKGLMVHHGVMAKIQSGMMTLKERHSRSARPVPGGSSKIYNYYDASGTYVATAHKFTNGYPESWLRFGSLRKYWFSNIAGIR